MPNTPRASRSFPKTENQNNLKTVLNRNSNSPFPFSLSTLLRRQPEKSSPWLGFNFRGSPDAPPAGPEYVTIYTPQDR